MGINSDRIPLTVKLPRETYIRLRDATARMEKPGGGRVTHQDFAQQAIENELKKKGKTKAS